MENLFEIYDNETKIGEMKVYAIGKNETYYFSYDKKWLENGFEIDPDNTDAMDEFKAEFSKQENSDADKNDGNKPRKNK